MFERRGGSGRTRDGDDGALRRGDRGGLRLIALVFYAVGLLVVLAAVNTPLIADEEFRDANRTTLNTLAAVAVVSFLAIFYAPWNRLPRGAFFTAPALGVVLISICTYYAGDGTASPTGSTCRRRLSSGCTSRTERYRASPSWSSRGPAPCSTTRSSQS